MYFVVSAISGYCCVLPFMSVDQLPYQIILVLPCEQVSYLKLKNRVRLS